MKNSKQNNKRTHIENISAIGAELSEANLRLSTGGTTVTSLKQVATNDPIRRVCKIDYICT